MNRIIVFVVIVLWLHPWHMKAPKPGIEFKPQPHSCDLGCSCTTLDPLTHCARPGIKPTPLQQPELLLLDSFFFFFFVFCPFRPSPVAYGGSQARGLIGAVATSLHHCHSKARSKLLCDLHHSSWQRRILNPLSKARDSTCNLMVPSWVHFHCTTMGTPAVGFLTHRAMKNY